MESHQTSCSYVPQHNEVAKRKNHHVFEIARTLLFDMHVTKHI